jgi:hypothetical protein
LPRRRKLSFPAVRVSSVSAVANLARKMSVNPAAVIVVSLTSPAPKVAVFWKNPLT